MDMPVPSSLDDMSELVARRAELHVRWPQGPNADTGGISSDDLTGVRLPGLSANPLAVEDWWGDRPLGLWVARRSAEGG